MVSRRDAHLYWSIGDLQSIIYGDPESVRYNWDGPDPHGVGTPDDDEEYDNLHEDFGAWQDKWNDQFTKAKSELLDIMVKYRMISEDEPDGA